MRGMEEERSQPTSYIPSCPLTNATQEYDRRTLVCREIGSRRFTGMAPIWEG